ncbi:MAG TPA: hypothetical protein VH207_03495 [Chthoniobacterales bacterium]|jgi:hypothetical protein|nr:hypothetical protein [Chthoniobacterales bacterium]
MTGATKKLLLDVREPGESILQNTAGKSLGDYSRSRLLRRAVERDLIKEVRVLLEAEEAN